MALKHWLNNNIHHADDLVAKWFYLKNNIKFRTLKAAI